VSGATRGFDRAVVLGGAGFVGSHLCDLLLDAGMAVVCVEAIPELVGVGVRNMSNCRFGRIVTMTSLAEFG
jgi:nucleoside-diphosphate-sugar epimerase